MRSLKERGVARELRPLIRRLKRSYAMERISKADFQYCLGRLEEVEARIISMQEFDEEGKEVCEPHGSEETTPDHEPG